MNRWIKELPKAKNFQNFKPMKKRCCFLLEGICDEVRSTRYGILSKMSDSDSILKKILETNIQIMEVTNTGRFWPDEYVMELKKQVSYL